MRRARRLFADGALAEALASYETALSHVRASASRERALLAEASVASLAVELEPGPRLAGRLREIFTESRSERARHVAGLALSRYYQARGDGRKGLFYARATRQNDGPADRWTSSHQVGVRLLACSQPYEALGWLREALDEWQADRAPVALSAAMLAYAAALVGSSQMQPYRATAEALLRNSESRWALYRPSIHIALGFAYLYRRRPEEAREHGDAALRALAVLPRLDPGEHRAALYLAGEAAAEVGDEEVAEARFATLLETYYPASRHVHDWLLWRTSGLVNWLA